VVTTERSTPIEDYAFLSSTFSAALVSRAGSIDWLAFPRFDSPAFFAALLGTEEHGRWTITPTGGEVTSTRAYRKGTLVLETEHRTPEGAVRVIDAMPTDAPGHLVRLVVGVRGRVKMRLELRARFDYGAVVPWVRRIDGDWSAVAGAEGLRLRTPVELRGEDLMTVADFTVAANEEIPFELAWHHAHEDPPDPVDVRAAISETEEWWRAWSQKCEAGGRRADVVRDSLVVLKGLSYTPTGGIVAAPTTSLPERLGGARNWDYRYCWIRDATYTLLALLEAGYTDEAGAWRDWLLRTLAGDPHNMQILYSVHGERRLPETEVKWLPGYEQSAPVRIGNAATEQLQLDVFGEVMDALYHARRAGIEPEPEAWEVQKVLLDFLESHWDDPDEGIWEVRGPRRDFTHSKVMAWVAVDRAVRTVEEMGLEGPLGKWKALCQRIHDEVCSKGVNGDGAFTQSYGSPHIDAANLMVPLVGFLPAEDPRVAATVDAVERELCHDGFVRRYVHDPDIDGLEHHEATFLPCSFWLVDNYAVLGREQDARELLDRLVDLRNDVGLLSEEYDPSSQRLLGNFPQALSHVALVNSATLAGHKRGGRSRSERTAP
jgi:GH15 family glucan-1,4-alpha-glucosidase